MKIETKQQAFDLYRKTRREFLDFARWTARKLITERGTITVDDLRAMIELPKTIDCRCWGAVFNTDEFKKLGYQSTAIKTSHGRPVAIWTLAGGTQ